MGNSKQKARTKLDKLNTNIKQLEAEEKRLQNKVIDLQRDNGSLSLARESMLMSYDEIAAKRDKIASVVASWVDIAEQRVADAKKFENLVKHFANENAPLESPVRFCIRHEADGETKEIFRSKDKLAELMPIWFAGGYKREDGYFIDYWERDKEGAWCSIVDIDIAAAEKFYEEVK